MPQLVDYLESLEEKGILKIKCTDLIGRSTTSPLSDGISCLAAVPPQAHHLVPEPYSWLVGPSSSTDFEDIYNSCFDEITRTFDMKSFERKCNTEISKIRESRNADDKIVGNGRERPNTKKSEGRGRVIYTGNKSWTVISFSNVPLAHPFEPPEPFTDRVRRLRRNKKIRASKLPVKERVKDPNGTADDSNESELENSESRVNNHSVHDIPYNTAFRNRR